MIEDLRHAAAASTQATKLSVDGPPASARTERPASTLLKRRRRWEISADHLGRLTVLSHSPPLHACGGFLRPEECAQLIGTASRVLVRSTVYGHAVDASRTSRSCLLARTRPECRPAIEKVLALSGALPEQVEDPQVTCYTRGQRYEPHCDGPELRDPQARRCLRSTRGWQLDSVCAVAGAELLTVRRPAVTYRAHLPECGPSGRPHPLLSGESAVYARPVVA